MTSLSQKPRKPREKNERLSKTVKAMLDNVTTGISIISPKMEVIWCNKVLKKQFPQIDFRKKSLCYQSFYSPPRKKICDYCPTIKAFKTGKISFAETDVCADGRIYNLIIIPVTDEKGKMSYVVETVEDITERKRAEEALCESEERYRSLAQTATDAIITVDSQANIIFWNQAAEAVFGYSTDEIMGKPLKLIMPKRFRKSQEKGLRRAVLTGKPKFAGKTGEFPVLEKMVVNFPWSFPWQLGRPKRESSSLVLSVTSPNASRQRRP